MLPDYSVADEPHLGIPSGVLHYSRVQLLPESRKRTINGEKRPVPDLRLTGRKQMPSG